MVLVLIPCKTKFDVEEEIRRIFSDAKIVTLSNRLLDDYSSVLTTQIANGITERLVKMEEELKKADKVYLVLVGGIMQNVVAYGVLEDLDIDYKFLIYEKKVRGYVELRRDFIISKLWVYNSD